MKLVLSQSAYVLLASSSVTIAAWRLMQWRARKRAKLAAERVQGMVKTGPLVSVSPKIVAVGLLYQSNPAPVTDQCRGQSSLREYNQRSDSACL